MLGMVNFVLEHLLKCSYGSDCSAGMTPSGSLEYPVRHLLLPKSWVSIIWVLFVSQPWRFEVHVKALSGCCKSSNSLCVLLLKWKDCLRRSWVLWSGTFCISAIFFPPSNLDTCKNTLYAALCLSDLAVRERIWLSTATWPEGWKCLFIAVLWRLHVGDLIWALMNEVLPLDCSEYDKYLPQIWWLFCPLSVNSCLCVCACAAVCLSFLSRAEGQLSGWIYVPRQMHIRFIRSESLS